MRKTFCLFLQQCREVRMKGIPVAITMLVGTAGMVLGWRQNPNPPPAPRDAVVEAQQPSAVQIERPEQQKTEHDRSNVFDPPSAKASSPVFTGQPKQGKNSGFDFYRDPLN